MPAKKAATGKARRVERKREGRNRGGGLETHVLKQNVMKNKLSSHNYFKIPVTKKGL